MAELSPTLPILASPPAVDAYAHFAPRELVKYLDDESGQKNSWHLYFDKNPLFNDVGARLEFMDEYGIQTSIMVPTPWVESTPEVAQNPAKFAEAVRICNDSLAQAAKADPGRLLNVALVPSFSPDAMVAELNRAIDELGMVGCELPVGPTMKRMDHPDMELLFARAEELKAPIWLHPSRPIRYPDYVDEEESEYFDWQTLGWLHDSSSAMIRIVMSGVFERHPNLKIVIHHAGALIPQFWGRMQSGWNDFQNYGQPIKTPISQPYIEHFKKFYIDTAIFAHDPALLHHAWEFFGPDKMLFGTDTPYEPNRGAFVNASRSSVEAMPITVEQKAMIYTGNAKKLLSRA